MPGNREFQRNGILLSNSSNSAADKVEDVMGKLKIGSSDDNGEVDDEQGVFPDRPGEPVCIYYLRTGTCGYGSNCRFNHPPNPGGQVHVAVTPMELPERAGQPECGYYLKTGTCKYGSTCKYHHPKDRQVDHKRSTNEVGSSVLLNVLGLPIRQDGKPCPYYMRTGSCRYGSSCKFHHPQPTSALNVLPVVGPIYGAGGSGVVPPTSGPPSAGEISSASLPKADYLPTSMPIPQSYIPIFLSPSQGWNTYMGSGPLPVTNGLTAPSSNANGQLSHLPERPDQPECRYYMTHGSCKYGSDCKYHHPREKVLQPAASSLGPLGLPLRPGQPVCAYYSHYGLCKYGPTCKFDHPLDGYSYAYSLSVPPFSSYPPASQYQGMQPLVSSSVISQPKSSKEGGCINNDETVSSNKTQLSNTQNVEDSSDVSESLPSSPKPSSGHDVHKETE